MKIVTADDGNNEHYKASEENWKVMKFDHFSKRPTPHDIKTAL